MTDLVFWAMAAVAVVTGWYVFRAHSMVRAAYSLLASFVAVGVILVLLGAEFLGLALLLMMAGELTIMAVFMVMFMMDPAGLNPMMMMVHQHRTAITAGWVAFLGLAAVGVFGRFPSMPRPATTEATAELGTELLGDSMLVFETAGVTLLATMIGALAIASKKGRYGPADEGSAEPELPGGSTAMADEAAMAQADEDEHAGHDMGHDMGHEMEKEMGHDMPDSSGQRHDQASRPDTGGTKEVAE